MASRIDKSDRDHTSTKQLIVRAYRISSDDKIHMHHACDLNFNSHSVKPPIITCPPVSRELSARH